MQETLVGGAAGAPAVGRHPVAGAGARALALLGPVGAGVVAGALWGAFFRWFMRFVTTDPEFTWSGTLFIVILFAVFGGLQGLAAGGRRLGLRRRWLTPLRLVAGFGLVLTLGGAGLIMAGTVVGGTLALHRRDWPRWVRAAVAALAGANLVLVAVMTGNEVGGLVRPVVAALWLAVIYAGIVGAAAATARPQPDGWRAPRSLRRASIGLLALACLPLAVLVGVG